MCALSSNVLHDQDWALIDVEPPFHRRNTFRIPGHPGAISIKGFIPNKELDHGIVHVVSAVSGVCQGYLSSNSTHWMYKRSIFEVRTILMDKELSNASLEFLGVVANLENQVMVTRDCGLFEGNGFVAIYFRELLESHVVS